MTASSVAQRCYAQLTKTSRGLPGITTLAITFALLAACAPARAAEQPAGIALNSVVVRGSTIYDAAELYSVYREHLGKPIDADAVRALTAAVSDRYAADGYARPQVRVEPALVAAGILRVDVVEMRIGAVDVTGDAGPYRERLNRMGAALRARAPVRQDDVQLALRRMRELPGLTIDARTARDDQQPDAFRLLLDAEFAPVSGSVRLSNRGTNEIGPNFLLGQLAFNGLFGGAGSAGTLWSAAVGDYAEYRGVGGFATAALGDSGRRVAATAFRSRSNPQERPIDRDVSYVRDRATLRVTLPPLVAGTWAPFVGMRFDDLEIDFNGARLRDERLRVVEGGVAATFRRASGVQAAASVEIAKGVDALGSGLHAADLSVDRRSADFSLARFTYARLQPIGTLWSLRFDVLAQHTANVLPYAERFKIGGERLGRGFEVAEIAGDRGAGAKVEARRSLVRAPARFGRTSLYGFYDIGAAFKQDTGGRESAASAGVGMSARTERTTSTFELAQPLTHADVEGDEDLSLFVEIVVGF